MIWLLLGAVALVAAALVLDGVLAASPGRLARLARLAGLVALAGLALLLVLRGQVGLAAMAGLAALGFADAVKPGLRAAILARLGLGAGGAGGGRGPRPDDRPGPGRTGRMTRREALAVLGLEDGAPPEAVIAAYRRLMKQMHPDRGGSAFLAAQVNEAKAVLLGE